MNHDDDVDELHDVGVEDDDKVPLDLDDGLLVPPEHPGEDVAEDKEEKEHQEHQRAGFKFSDVSRHVPV